MKKIFALVLAVVMLASFGVTAFATENAETNDGSKSTSIAVNGKFKEGAPSDDVISVNVVWDEMNFTYTAASKGTWNPQTHGYDGATAGEWTWDGATESKKKPFITVTNHSNINVVASFAFTPESDGIVGEFGRYDSFTIISGEGSSYEDAFSFTTVFSISGGEINSDKRIGTVTVSIKPDFTLISSAEELLASADKKGIFKLACDIDLGDSTLEITSENYTLNLNGKKLSGTNNLRLVTLSTNGGASIINGKLYSDTANMAAVENFGGYLILEECEIDASTAPAFITTGTASLSNCTLNGNSGDNTVISSGTGSVVYLSGDVRVNNAFSLQSGASAMAFGGTYNFNVESYVNTESYTVTNDGTIWTVAEK